MNRNNYKKKVDTRTDILYRILIPMNVLRLNLFARTGRNYIVKVSLKTQADDSFPKSINRKIHFRCLRWNNVYLFFIKFSFLVNIER